MNKMEAAVDTKFRVKAETKSRLWYFFVLLLLASSLTNAQAPSVPFARMVFLFPNQLRTAAMSKLELDDSHDILLLKGMSFLPFKSQEWPPISRDGMFGAPRSYSWHNGIDFMVPLHTPVYAARAGIVIRAERFDLIKDFGHGYGGLVVVEHIDGSQSWYAHLDRVRVHVGQMVTHDTKLGLSGGRNNGHSTGPHLHFMIVRKNGEAINPQLAFWKNPS